MSERTNWNGVAFGLGLAFFGAYQLFKLPVVLPLLLETYGYDRTLAGGFMSIYAVAGMLFSFMLGKVLQERGPVVPVAAGLVLMILGNLLGLVSPASGWIVLGGRALEGAAFAVFAIAGPTLANQSASARALPFIFGATAAWIPIGQIAATLLAQPALAAGAWQALWWLGIGAALLFLLWTRGVARHLPGAGRAKAGAGMPAAARITPAERLSLIIAGAMFLVFSGQYFAYMTWMPQYLIEVHGFSLEDAVWGYLLPVFMLLPMNFATGWLIQRGWPIGLLLTAAMAVQAVCWWLLPVTGAGWGGVLSTVSYGLMAGMAPTCIFAMPSALLGQGRQAAQAFGILMTGRNLGVLIGPVLLAELFRWSQSWDLAAPVFGGLTTLSLLGAVWLWRRLSARRR